MGMGRGLCRLRVLGSTLQAARCEMTQVPPPRAAANSGLNTPKILRETGWTSKSVCTKVGTKVGTIVLESVLKDVRQY